jgi:hypothetical protein
MKWWKKFADPPGTIGNALLTRIPNTRDLDPRSRDPLLRLCVGYSFAISREVLAIPLDIDTDANDAQMVPGL